MKSTAVRLDVFLAQKGLVSSRSQAESEIRLGHVTVAGKVVKKAGFAVNPGTDVRVAAYQDYVSRAAYKLADAVQKFAINFAGATVLDVGSSTGGFTQYALRDGAEKVIAVEVGTNQLHPSLRTDPRIELHEQTDIRSVRADDLVTKPDYILIDASFISLRDLIPHIMTLCTSNTRILAMVKPQFEANSDYKHKGVIKNDHMRRDILKNFELWVKQYAGIIDKSDNEVAGAKGNRERFYVLKPKNN